MALTTITTTGWGGGTGQSASQSFPSASGTGPATGVSGTDSLSGPWMVEEQHLDYRYKRVPWFYFTPGAITLSSLNVSSVTTGTRLLVQLTNIYYKKTKVSEDFSTSTYTHPQRFTIYALSADETGMSYGTPTLGTFSVGGEVKTTQNWYFRREWDNAIDTEISCKLKYSNGTNYTGAAFNYFGINNFDCSTGPLFNDARHVPINTPTLTEPMFWKSLGAATYHNRDFVVMDGPNTAFSQYLSCDTSINSNEDVAPTIIQTTQAGFGWKTGTYISTHDSIDDVRNVTNLIGHEIQKNYPGLPDNGPEGFCDTPDAQDVRNIYYENTRHYWGV